MIEFKLDLKPTPKRTKQRSNYTENHKSTDSFIAEVRRRLIPEKITPLSGAISMVIRFIYERPKYIKDSEPQRKPKMTTPYVTNLAISLLEALKGIAYTDSRAICDLRTVKYHGAIGEKDGIEVEIKPFNLGLMTQITVKCAEGEARTLAHARTRQRELNKAEHEAKQAERHEQLSIEREAKKQARSEAHRLEQKERDRLAKIESENRSNEKLKKCTEDRLREKAEREAERKRVRQAEQDDYLQKLLMMGSPRRYLEEDDDE
jgi:hypothetical protein